MKGTVTQRIADFWALQSEEASKAYREGRGEDATFHNILANSLFLWAFRINNGKYADAIERKNEEG